MNHHTMARRLAQLEQAAVEKESEWLRTLSDAELDAYCDGLDPMMGPTIEALSDADLHQLVAGKMPMAEWEAHRRRTQEHGE